MDRTIKTSATHPDHPVVGKRFYAWNGATYFCDSYDPSCGFWMTPEKPTESGEGSKRTCVSERAPGRTWHEIDAETGRVYGCIGAPNCKEPRSATRG